MNKEAIWSIRANLFTSIPSRIVPRKKTPKSPFRPSIVPHKQAPAAMCLFQLLSMLSFLDWNTLISVLFTLNWYHCYHDFYWITITQTPLQQAFHDSGQWQCIIYIYAVLYHTDLLAPFGISFISTTCKSLWFYDHFYLLFSKPKRIILLIKEKGKNKKEAKECYPEQLQ